MDTPSFFDGFSTGEHALCERLRAQLAPHAWAATILRRVDERGLTLENRPALLELLIAGELARLGIAAVDYEPDCPGVTGNVDFSFPLAGRNWRVEAVYVADTRAVVDATHEVPFGHGVSVGELSLSDLNEDRRVSEAGEMLKIQEKIAEKVFDRTRGIPIKFPVPNDNAVHVVAVDVRRYLLGHMDRRDAGQIAYGPRAAGPYVQYWGPQGAERPIRGLFEEQNPLAAAGALRERIHFLLLMPMRSFAEGALLRGAFICANPNLLGPEHAQEILRTWPGRCTADFLAPARNR
jgi:hypothetical protein